MAVNFVFDKIDPNSNIPESNLLGHYYNADWNYVPYWSEWGGDVSKHLLKDSAWGVTEDAIIQCNLTSKSWDLYARCDVLKGVPYIITVDIKLETATNCNISILDSDVWKFLGGESFNIDDHLSTSEWKSVSVAMLPSESGFIHLHIGALDSHLPSQEEGTVLIKNLRVKSVTSDTLITSFGTHNGSYTVLRLRNTKHNPPYILLSEVDKHKTDFNVYPIVITTAEYQWCWPLFLLGKHIVDLINEDKLKILFLCSFEPLVLSGGMALRQIHKQVSTICGLQRITRLDNIIFATSDSSIESRLIEYKTEITKYNDDVPLIKFKDINAYGHVVPKILKSSNNINWLEVYCNNYYNKSHLFLYLNNRITYHRFLLYKQIEYKNLLQHGIYSWHGFNQSHRLDYDPIHDFHHQVNTTPTFNEEEQKFIDYVMSNPKVEIAKIQDDSADLSVDPLREGSYVDPDWIANTYFSVVTETHVGDLPSHITEKIYKLIFCCHPFIVIGPRYHLATLRRYGFKTFPELFDESYDSMPESFEKYNLVSDQIKFYTTEEGKKKLEQLLPTLRSTLEYNRNHLLSLSSDDVWNSLEQLYENN
jgi:hypothetical protein